MNPGISQGSPVSEDFLIASILEEYSVSLAVPSSPSTHRLHSGAFVAPHCICPRSHDNYAYS